MSSKKPSLPSAPVSKPEISDALRQRIAEISSENAKYRVKKPAAPQKSAEKKLLSITRKHSSEEEKPTEAGGSGGIAPRRPSRRPLLPPALAGKLLTKPAVTTRRRPSNENRITVQPEEKIISPVLVKKETGPENKDSLIDIPLTPTATSDEADTIPRTQAKDFAERKAKLDEARARFLNKDNEGNRINEAPQKYKGPPVARSLTEIERSVDNALESLKKDKNDFEADTLKATDENLLKKKVVLLEATLSSTEERFHDAKKRHEKELEEMREKYEKQIEELKSSGSRSLSRSSSRGNGDIRKLKEELEQTQFELQRVESSASAKEKVQERKYAMLTSKFEDLEKEAEMEKQELLQKISALEEEMSSRSMPVDNSLSDRIQELEKEILALQETTVPADHHDHVKKILEEELEQMKDMYDRLETVNKELSSQLGETNVKHSEELKEAHDLLDSMKEELSKQKRAAEEQQEKIRFYTDKIDDLSMQREDLEAMTDKLRQELSQCEDELFELRAGGGEKVKELEMKILNAQESRDKALQEKDEIEIRYNATQQDLKELVEAHDLEKQELNRNIEDLLNIYETVQQENVELRDRLHVMSAKDLSKSTSSLNSEEKFLELESEKEALEKKVLELEYCISDMNTTISSLQEDCRYLEEQLEKSKSRRPSAGTSEPQFISNDEQLLDFINTMTNKNQIIMKESEDLRSENHSLRRDLAKFKKIAEDASRRGAPSDSAYHSSMPTSPATSNFSRKFSADADTSEKVRTLAADFDALSISEQKLQDDYNKLLHEFDSVSMRLSTSEAENKKLEDLVEDLRNQVSDLRDRLTEEMANNLGVGEGGEAPTLANMRRDFRKAMDNARKEFDEAIQKEMNERFAAEKALRSLKREQEMACFTKKHGATQTMASLTR